MTEAGHDPKAVHVRSRSGRSQENAFDFIVLDIRLLNRCFQVLQRLRAQHSPAVCYYSRHAARHIEYWATALEPTIIPSHSPLRELVRAQRAGGVIQRPRNVVRVAISHLTWLSRCSPPRGTPSSFSARADVAEV